MIKLPNKKRNKLNQLYGSNAFQINIYVNFYRLAWVENYYKLKLKIKTVMSIFFFQNLVQFVDKKTIFLEKHIIHNTNNSVDVLKQVSNKLAMMWNLI